MRRYSLTLTIASTLLLLALYPTSAFAIRRPHRDPTPRGKLFVFVQGINSSLTPSQAAANNNDGDDPYFFGTGHLGTYLESQGYSNARYLEYSYVGSNNTGQPQPYTCQDTYNYPLATHITELSQQIRAAVRNAPNTDIYVLAHSMGGIVALGYVASLLEHVGNVVPLPNNRSILKGIITLDSPLGGVTNNPDYGKLIFLRSLPCEGLDAWNTVAVSEMQALFQTATSSTAMGTTSSIIQAILKGSYVSNQQVANDAKKAKITILSLGNTNDLLWRPSVCNKVLKTNMQDFSSTQWLQDEGNNSLVYSRMFTSGFQNCLLGTVNHENHFDVLDTPTAEQVVAQIVNGSTPG